MNSDMFESFYNLTSFDDDEFSKDDYSKFYDSVSTLDEELYRLFVSGSTNDLDVAVCESMNLSTKMRSMTGANSSKFLIGYFCGKTDTYADLCDYKKQVNLIESFLSLVKDSDVVAKVLVYLFNQYASDGPCYCVSELADETDSGIEDTMNVINYFDSIDILKSSPINLGYYRLTEQGYEILKKSVKFSKLLDIVKV